MSRKAMVWWTSSTVAAVALGALWFSGPGYPVGPKPVFADDSGVLSGVEHGPIPPEWDNGDPAVAVVVVRSDSASFYAEGDPYVQSARVRVGESVALKGVTIALCDVWYNRRSHGGWWTTGWRTGEVGARLVNPSTAYYVTSYDGSTPSCP